MSGPSADRWPRPSVMGIVNVTPDSFSDGGSYASADEAVDSARRMLADGAALVDVGGESTRPGAEAVSQDEELRRVVPVLESLAGLPGVDRHVRAEVARRAVALGAAMVNDVSALRREPDLAGVVAEAGVDVCLMHMLGTPRTMQVEPRYDDVVDDVAAFLEERLAFAVGAGIAEERICLDPGIGFGKTADHNLELLRRLDRIVRARSPGARRGLAEVDARAGPRRRRPGRDRRRVRRRRRGRVRPRRDALPRPRRRSACRGARRGRRGRARGSRGMTIELRGIELYGFHGVLDDERERGQLFVVDLELELDPEVATTAAESDRIEDAVDYRDVVDVVGEVSDARAYRLLEAFSTALADTLLARFPLARVRVAVRKPEVVLARPVDDAAVVVERTR